MAEPYLYIYCLCRSGLSLPQGSRGLGGNPLYILTWKEVSAVVSSAQEGGYLPTPENALLHEQVVEEVQLQSTVIPMRFSSILCGRALVIELLRDNYQSIKDALEGLEGRIEVSLRLFLPADPAVSPLSGYSPGALPPGLVVGPSSVSGRLKATNFVSGEPFGCVIASPPKADEAISPKADSPPANNLSPIRNEIAAPLLGARNDLPKAGEASGPNCEANPKEPASGRPAPTEAGQDTQGNPPRPDPSGEKYLLERQRLYNLKDHPEDTWIDTVVLLSQRLYPYWEKTRHEIPEHHPSILCLYFLLRKERFQGFLEGVESLKKSHPGLRLLFSGPWPPYNFVPADLIQKGVKP